VAKSVPIGPEDCTLPFLLRCRMRLWVSRQSEEAMTFIEGGVEWWAIVTLTGQYGDEQLYL